MGNGNKGKGVWGMGKRDHGLGVWERGYGKRAHGQTGSWARGRGMGKGVWEKGT